MASYGNFNKRVSSKCTILNETYKTSRRNISVNQLSSIKWERLVTILSFHEFENNIIQVYII